MIVMENLTEVIEEYNKDLDMIPDMYQTVGAGKARNLSGLLYENFITNICKIFNLDARKDDYKISEMINGFQVTNLQVDKHIYKNNVLKKLVESKTYLDVCYLKRAVDDMIDLYFSPEVNDKVEYAIFTGQKCLAENSMNFHMEKFKRRTGKTLKIFVFNKNKKRNAKRGIYMKEYKDDFSIDMEVVKEFVKWLNK
jgi:hypothetical protein